VQQQEVLRPAVAEEAGDGARQRGLRLVGEDLHLEVALLRVTQDLGELLRVRRRPTQLLELDVVVARGGHDQRVAALLLGRHGEPDAWRARKDSTNRS